MRHQGCKDDLADRLRLVGTGYRERPVLEDDVGFGSFQQMGRDLLALGHDLVAGLDQGFTTDRQRARAIGAHADRRLRGVAVDHVDIFDGDAQLLGDDLGEGGFVALAVAMRAGEHLHLAGMAEADLGAFPQAYARTERSHHRRRGDAAASM